MLRFFASFSFVTIAPALGLLRIVFGRYQINGDKPIVIDFWATWCGPCRVIGPIFEKISDTPAGEKLGFYKVDVDTQEKIAQEVGIQAMPTFVFFHKGQAIEKVVGANPSALQVSSSFKSRKAGVLLLPATASSSGLHALYITCIRM